MTAYRKSKDEGFHWKLKNHVCRQKIYSINWLKEKPCFFSKVFLKTLIKKGFIDGGNMDQSIYRRNICEYINQSEISSVYCLHILDISNQISHESQCIKSPYIFTVIIFVGVAFFLIVLLKFTLG